MPAASAVHAAAIATASWKPCRNESTAAFRYPSPSAATTACTLPAPTFCACCAPAAPTRPCHEEAAALTPTAPRTARQTEEPICLDALSTLEAAPDTPGGTSRIATCVVAGTKVPNPPP